MINADFVGISADEQSQVDLIAGNDNIIAANNAIVSWTNGRINLTALNGSNVLNGIYFGISGYDNSDITLNAPSGRNIINVTDGAGILADNTKIRLKAENNSIISQKGIAVDATVGSSVNIIGRQNNYIDGLIYVKDKGTVVNIGNFFGAGNVKDSGNNYIIINIDGNDLDQIDAAFKEAKTVKGQPTAIIAKTLKGKGVSFMENQAGWHGKAPNDEEYKIAMEDLEKAGEALCQM